MKRFFFSLFALLGVVQATWAQTDDYITEVMLIGGSKSEVTSMIDDYTDDEGLVVDNFYTVIQYDLNKGAKGKYVYLLCKYRSTPQLERVPITDIYLRVCENKPNPIPQTLTHNGHTYQLAKLGGNNDFNNQGGDLNYGVSGKYIYLYYTTENLIPGRRIRNIHFDGNSTLAVGENGGSSPCDLNKGAGGNYVYMHLERFSTDAICEVSTEEQLKEAVTLNVANIRLAADITLTQEVVIQEGRTVTLDLNGKTLNRGLSSATNYGHVLKVLSGNKLTVLDSSGNNSGSIRGGYTGSGGAINNLGTFILNGGTIEASNSTNHGAGIWNQSGATLTINGGIVQNCKTTSSNGKGGGIYNQGTLTINDGTIRSNTCAGRGGGIYNEGTLTINGGTIQGNTCSTNGGGIYNDGELFIQANPIVSNNTKGSAANNVYLPNGKVVSVAGTFTSTDGAHIGITPESDTSVLTAFYSNYNPYADPHNYFFIDNVDRYAVLSSGEVYEGLYWKSGDATCTLNTNNAFYVYGTGAMADFTTSTPWGTHHNLIKAVVIDDGITHIGSQSFTGATSLTDISIGKGVTRIGDHAFSGCTSLNTFSIPANVTSIGAGAFYQCGTDVYCYTNPNHLTVDDGLQGSFKNGKATRFHVLGNFLSDYQRRFPDANVTWDGALVLSDNWTDDGNFAGSFSNQSGNTVTITTPAELARVAYMVNQQKNNLRNYTFKLDRDLDMSGHKWVPIGGFSYSTYFQGTFDGQGHTISGLVVDRSDSYYNGLFGWVGERFGVDYYGTVKNLRIADSNIKGGQYTGAIAGYLKCGTVENCFVDASVSVKGGNYTGGIVGAAAGYYYFGEGLYYDTEILHNALITHSLFAGSVTGTGGNKGAVCGSGSYYETTGSFFTKSSLKGFSTDAGKNVFAIPISTGTEGIHLIFGENETITYNATTYVAANGSATLTVEPDDPSKSITEVRINGTQVGTTGGPYTLDMIANASECVVTATMKKFMAGSGTEADPYTIGSLEDWTLFASLVNEGMTFADNYVVLTDDIDNITTMVGVSETACFQGTFDGQNHKLTANLNSSADCVSLFPYLKDAIVNRVHVDGSFIVGQYGAALVGQAYGSNLIEDVKVTATVSMYTNMGDNQTYRIGGVVGNVNATLTMRGVVFSGTINSNTLNTSTYSRAYTGGLIGCSIDGSTLTLKDCLFCGTYNGTTNIGLSMPFHPIALRESGISVTLNTSSSNVLYVNTITPDAGDFVAISGEPAAERTNSSGGMILTDAYNMLTAYQTGIFYNGKYYLQPMIELADNADNSQTLTDNANKTSNVLLANRTLYFDRDWNTLCLPFNMTAEQLAASPLAGATLMELNGNTSAFEETSGTLTLNFTDATTIVAGKPYLMKWKNGLTVTGGTEGLYGAGGAGALSYLTDGIIDPGDGTSKKWCARSSNQTWFAEFSTAAPISVSSYTMTTGNDTYPDYLNRNPKVWTLQAKVNANDEWITIDTRNSADALPATNFTSKSFDVATSGTYQYFRLYITQNGGGDLIQLSEFSINGAVQDPMFTGVTISGATPAAVNSSDGKVSFTGTYIPMSFDAEDKSKLLLGGGNTLYYPEAGANIKAQRAYFQLSPNASQGIRAFVLNFGDDEQTQGVTTPLSNRRGVGGEASEPWFSLDGRRLSGKPTKAGLYIVNGTKVVVK